MGILIVQALGFHKMEIHSRQVAVWTGCWAVKYIVFPYSQTSLPKEIGSMKQRVLIPTNSSVLLGS